MSLSRLFIAVSAAAFAASALPLGHAAAAATVNSEVAGIFAKHAAYVGQPQGLVLTYTSKRTAKAPAPRTTPAPGDPTFPAASSVTYRRGALYREVQTGAGVTEQEGFTGRAFWSANYNGFTVVDYENAARRRLTTNIIEGDLLGADVPATSRGSKTVDGVTADVVRVSPVNGIPADIAFDQKTGAYVEVTYDPDNRSERYTVHVDGYTEAAPGIRVPSGYHTGELQTWNLTEKTVRVVTNDDLRGPVPTAKWKFESTDTTPIDVVEFHSPYALGSTSGAVHMHASIGGHPGTFLLDSGAAGIILSKPYADKLKYTKLGRTGFIGVNGGGIGARYARLTDPIEVGKNSLHDVIVTVQDGAAFGEVDGIVGYDFLAGALVDVDTGHKTLRILDPGTMQPAVGPGAYAFTVNLADRTPAIMMKAAGATAYPTFDTGNSAWVMLSGELASSGKIVALTDVVHIFAGVDGLVRAKCSHLALVEVGPYKYEKAETCFTVNDVFGRDGGLIGFDFLKHFNWTFDYPESKFVLTPNGK